MQLSFIVFRMQNGYNEFGFTVHLTLHAYIRTLHKIIMFMPVSVVTLLPTLVRWTLHDTKSPVRPSDVIVYGSCVA